MRDAIVNGCTEKGITAAQVMLFSGESSVHRGWSVELPYWGLMRHSAGWPHAMRNDGGFRPIADIRGWPAAWSAAQWTRTGKQMVLDTVGGGLEMTVGSQLRVTVSRGGFLNRVEWHHRGCCPPPCGFLAVSESFCHRTKSRRGEECTKIDAKECAHLNYWNAR